MHQLQNTTLCLSTQDVNCTPTNSHTNFTWSGINLRVLLGSMYNQYDYFNLVLSSVSSFKTDEYTGTGAKLGTTDADLKVIAKISGLPFINQTYNTSSGNNTNTSTLIPINFEHNSSIAINDCYNTILTFNKQQEVVNLNIFYETYIGDTTFWTEIYYPDMVFLFKIYGVKQNNEIINHRMMYK